MSQPDKSIELAEVVAEEKPEMQHPVQVDLAEQKHKMQDPARVSTRQLTSWDPENEEFWEKWGSAVAWKNLYVSIPNLLMMFASWLMWSVVVTGIQTAHEQGLAEGKSVYDFKDLELDPTDQKGYQAALLTINAVAGLSGATLRIPNTFLVAPAGGHITNAMNSTLALVPMAMLYFALRDPDCPFWLLLVIASMSGIGGGAFASSMSSISFFFPKKQQGLALGLNAGLGNLGVSVCQFLLPLVTSVAFVDAAQGGSYMGNAGLVFFVFLLLCAGAAWTLMNHMPQHGSSSMFANALTFLHLEGIGFLGVVFVAVIVASTNAYVKSPALLIVRIFCVAISGCLLTLVALRFLAGGELKEKLIQQSAIFKDVHTWYMTWLYIMTFGSFIGYSNVFPKLIQDVFGYLPATAENPDVRPPNPNAPSVAHFAWMGACVGSLARPLGGVLSDKVGGAAVTHWGTIVQVVATVLVGFLISSAQEADQPETIFPYFLICFLILFGSTGAMNGSTFRQMSVIFPPEKAGPVLGWTSAVAAYGAGVFPACFQAGLKGDFVPMVMYALATYYGTCLIINYWHYYRKGAAKPC